MTEMTKEELEYEKEFNDYIEHHGIIGQKWGTLNGPPYPLKESLSKTISRVGQEIKTASATTYAKALAESKAKKEIAAEKKAIKEEEKAKKEAEKAEKKAEREEAKAEKKAEREEEKQKKADEKAQKEAEEKAKKDAEEADKKIRDEREKSIQDQIDNPRRLSDDELNKLVARLEKEKRLGELTTDKLDTNSQKQNESYTNKVLKKVGDAGVNAIGDIAKNTLTTAGSLFVASMVDKSGFDTDIFSETMKATVSKSLKGNSNNTGTQKFKKKNIRKI